MRTQRHLRDWPLPSRLERASSAVGLLTRMRSSTSSSSRTSHQCYQCHTTWLFKVVRIRWWAIICRVGLRSLQKSFSPHSEGSWRSVKWSSSRPTVSSLNPRALTPVPHRIALRAPRVAQQRWRRTKRFLIVLWAPLSREQKYCRFQGSMRIVGVIFDVLAPVCVATVWKDGNLGMQN